MTPYGRTKKPRNVSEDESQDTWDETMVYLRVLYFCLSNLKITKI